MITDQEGFQLSSSTSSHGKVLTIPTQFYLHTSVSRAKQVDMMTSNMKLRCQPLRAELNYKLGQKYLTISCIFSCLAIYPVSDNCFSYYRGIKFDNFNCSPTKEQHINFTQPTLCRGRTKQVEGTLIWSTFMVIWPNLSMAQCDGTHSNSSFNGRR